MSEQSERKGFFIEDHMSWGHELSFKFRSENVDCRGAHFRHSCGGDKSL